VYFLHAVVDIATRTLVVLVVLAVGLERYRRVGRY
jgi:hypothetical protein